MSKTAIRIIAAALLPFSLLQIVARRYPQFRPDLMDGLQGLLLGIVMGMLVLMSRRKGTGTRKCSEPEAKTDAEPHTK